MKKKSKKLSVKKSFNSARRHVPWDGPTDGDAGKGVHAILSGEGEAEGREGPPPPPPPKAELF